MDTRRAELALLCNTAAGADCIPFISAGAAASEPCCCHAGVVMWELVTQVSTSPNANAIIPDGNAGPVWWHDSGLLGLSRPCVLRHINAVKGRPARSLRHLR